MREKEGSKWYFARFTVQKYMDWFIVFVQRLQFSGQIIHLLFYLWEASFCWLLKVFFCWTEAKRAITQRTKYVKGSPYYLCSLIEENWKIKWFCGISFWMEHNWFKSFMKLVLIGINSKFKIPWKKTAQAFWDM